MGDEIPEQQLIDRYTRQDELMLQMIWLLQEIKNKPTPETPESPRLKKLIELMEYQHDVDYEILTLGYPKDATYLTIAAGTTTFDFESGTVMAPGVSVANMSKSLGQRRKDWMRSLMVDANKDVTLQLDDRDRVIIPAGRWISPNKQFKKARITVTEDTEIFVVACTHPDAIGTSGESYRFSGTLVDSKSGVAVAAESAAVAFDRVVNRVRVIANDYDMYIRTSADGTNWEDPIHAKADIEQVFDVACHSFKVQRYGVNDVIYEVEGYR